MRELFVTARELLLLMWSTYKPSEVKRFFNKLKGA